MRAAERREEECRDRLSGPVKATLWGNRRGRAAALTTLAL